MKRKKRARINAILPVTSESLIDVALSTDSPVTSLPVTSLPERESPSFARLGGLGGLDSMFSMMGKVQQFFGIFQQIRPAFRMVGSLLGPKALVSGIPVSRIKPKAAKAQKRSSSHKAVLHVSTKRKTCQAPHTKKA
ncbi:hypothetical protein [Paenibacillus sinopodophylli]|uniref:hypothetical protein n=1 Tax=Paenibacillus sinopodophylli TaxID=1837342 RepID=UPI00110D11BF|nr:hypothetical protein [Paenibacillus sinopodophylli]